MTKTIKHITAKYSPILAPLLLGLASSCSRTPAQVGPPPPEVVVAIVSSKDIAVEREGVATLEGFITATINAQLQGYLISRDYREGGVVKKGDLLFQIDPRPYEAALAQSQGNLATARANQVKSEADVKRAIKLFEGKVISDQERDTSINAASVGKANVQSAEAAVRQAEINLSYTKITAPIDGIVGIAKAHVGDLVGPTSGALTTISQMDPIKAAINLGEQSFNEFLTNHPDADERERYLKGLRFDLFLGNGSLYPRKGDFYAEDRNLDAQTGAIRVELTFPNPGNLLRPGQFGKIRTVIERQRGALVIPQEAVMELQGNQTVAAVNNDSTISIRPVTTGERVDGMWQVTKGLKLGEKVVVKGMQKARPGSLVRVTEWSPPAVQLAATESAQSKEEN